MKVITSIWLALSILGLVILASYQSDAGAQGAAPLCWPAGSSLTREKSNTLLIFLHPKCPCSMASAHEMTGLLNQKIKQNTSVYAIFVAPKGVPQDFVDGPLYKYCSQIEGLKIVQDRDAVEANKFAARTSGQIYIYDQSGKLQFNGGITPGRGHEGDSLGFDRCREILAKCSADKQENQKQQKKQEEQKKQEVQNKICPVFGCPLQSDGGQTK